LWLLWDPSESPSFGTLPDPLLAFLSRDSLEASSETIAAFSALGDVLELVLLEKSSVWTVASLVFREARIMVGSFPGIAGVLGFSSSSGEGARGSAVAGRVVFKICGTSSSLILLQDPDLCPLFFVSSSLLARPLESEDEDRIEERLVTRLSMLILGEEACRLKVSLSCCCLGPLAGPLRCAALHGLSELVLRGGRLADVSRSPEPALVAAGFCFRRLGSGWFVLGTGPLPVTPLGPCTATFSS